MTTSVQDGFPALPVTSRTGAEAFHDGDRPLGGTLLDFWRWAASDLVGNTMRGILAEYLVASALGLRQTVRPEWQAFDLETAQGTKIEVKSAAYLQTWHQVKPSAISFGIQPTRAWDADSGRHETERKRQAGLYIFCLLHYTVKQTLDPMDLSQWRFYVLPTSVLDRRFPVQKTISRAGLVRLQPEKTNYDGLKACIAGCEQRTGRHSRLVD